MQGCKSIEEGLERFTIRPTLLHQESKSEQKNFNTFIKVLGPYKMKYYFSEQTSLII